MKIIFSLLMMISFNAFAQIEYYLTIGTGTLAIKDKSFSIETMGENAHSCSLSGDIKNNIAKLEGFENKVCEIKFTNNKDGINITSKGRACSSFCGARASFEGQYNLTPKGCYNDEIIKTKKEFKSLYDKKQYKLALKKITPILENCEKMLYWTEKNWIKNDIAITYFKLKEKEKCNEFLSKVEEDIDVSMSEQEIQTVYPPADADNYIELSSATKQNKKLCKIN